MPRHIIEVPDIPYTRSGKKVELAVARMINGSSKADNRDALANPEALDRIGENGRSYRAKRNATGDWKSPLFIILS